MAIISKNSTIYIPTFGEKYTKEISVLVFYPGIPVGGKDGKVYMPPLIQKVVPDWFKKYVIVIPNKHTSDWDLVKSEYSIEMKNVGLVEKNLSVGCFSGSGNSSSSIQKNLSKLSVLNLMLMDPSSTGTIQTNVKTLKSKGTICYLMYNPNNWKSYPDTVAGFKPLSTAVGENVLNTKSVKYDHEDIPGKFLVKWRDSIEKSLTTPILIDSVIPNTISEGNKQSTDNTTPIKTPETSSDATRKTEVDANTGNGTKLKMRIGGLNTDNPVVVSVREPLNDFTIYVGDPIVTDSNSDEFTDLPELDSEYSEGDYQGLEEFGFSLEEIKLQDSVSSGQESALSGLTAPGDPVDIKPVSSFDALLKLAGKCARTLGKNPKVKYENLRIGYTKGIHGLCPQGTACVLYAMTGIKNIQPMVASANYLSFGKKTGNSTTYGEASFPTKYYNDKVKIGKDYWKDKSRWQVGDVVVVAYIGKNHGHIQCWTGTYWMSDFKQNSIQATNVDWNTPALWRMNTTGLEIVKKQMGSITV
jgi:hypothetical protein